jgi:putative transposase
MSRKYKFHDKDRLYFVSFATVYWIDVFVRDQYFYEVVKSLDYCRKNIGMEIYAWCIMPSHIHLIFRAQAGNSALVLGKFKEHTSK